MDVAVLGDVDDSTANDAAIAALLQAEWAEEDEQAAQAYRGSVYQNTPPGAVSVPFVPFVLQYSSVGIQPSGSGPVFLTADDAFGADDAPLAGLSQVTAEAINECYGEQLVVFVEPGDDYEEGDTIEVIDVTWEGITISIGPSTIRFVPFLEYCEADEDVGEAFMALLEEAKKERDFDVVQKAEAKWLGYKHESLEVTMPRRQRGGASGNSYGDDEVAYDPAWGVASYQPPPSVSSRWGAEERLAEAREKSSTAMHFTLAVNACQTSRKLLTVDTRPATWEAFLRLVSKKFNRKGKKAFRRVFSEDGNEIHHVKDLKDRHPAPEIEEEPSAKRFKMDTVERIGIMGALPEEVKKLNDHVEDKVVHDEGKVLSFTTGTLGGKPVVYAMANVGTVFASSVATTLIREFNAKAIVFSGVAGGLVAGQSVGDIVIGDVVVNSDMNVKLFKFEMEPDYVYTRGELPFLKWKDYAADPKLLELALAAPHPTDVSVSAGRIVTTSEFQDEKRKAELADLWAEVGGAVAVEMECAAVAQICKAYEVPFVGLRALSDTCTGDVNADFAAFAAEAADRLYPIVEHIVANYE